MLAIADVAVPVTNAAESARWWTEKLGFATHTVGAPGGHAVMVAPPGERFLLHLCEGFAPVEPGNTGIAFLTDDIEAQVRSMESAGVRFSEPLQKQEWGGMAKFADPDGNVFWLVSAPRKFIRTELGRRAPEAPPVRRGGRRTAPPRSRRPGRRA